MNVLESFEDLNKPTHRILWITEYFDTALQGVMIYKNQWAYFNVLTDFYNGKENKEGNLLYGVYKLTDKLVHQLVEYQISYVSNYGTKYTVHDYTKGYKNFIYNVYSNSCSTDYKGGINIAKPCTEHLLIDPIKEDLDLIGLITLTPTEIFNRDELRDPKYLGVSNINFSLVSPEYDNSGNIQKRIETGFDDSELWDLGATIAKFIYPRLERFNEYTPVKEIPKILKALDIIIKASDSGENSAELYYKPNSKLSNKVQKQLHKLADILLGLWI